MQRRRRHTPMPLPKVLSHVIVPVLTGLIMCAAYLGGFHKPNPHDIRVAVVGAPATSGPVAASIQSKVGRTLDITTVANEDEARDQIQKLSLAGAFVPGNKPTLLAAPAASDAQASVVQKVFTAVAAAQDKPLAITEVVPLDDSDPVGQNAFFFMVALSVGAYSTAVSIGAAGASRRIGERLLIGLGACVLISSAMMLIAGGGFGMFPGHRLAIWATSLLYTCAIMLIGVGLHPLLGRFTGMCFSAIFVQFNFTSSGGVFPSQMQPGLYGWLHQVWIGAGFIEAAKRIMYFPQASSRNPFGIMLLWLLGGALCVAVASVMERRIYTQWLSRNQAKISREANAAAGIAPADAGLVPAHAAAAATDVTLPDVRTADSETLVDAGGFPGARGLSEGGAHLPSQAEQDRLDDEELDEETELELEENMGRS